MKIISIIFLFMVFPLTAIPQIMDTGLESIKGDKLVQTVKILTSVEFDGRLSGSEGYNKAANFVAERFAANLLYCPQSTMTSFSI